MFVALYTTETGEISRRSVALHTLVPFVFMVAAVYPEILLVVVERRRIPTICRMASLTRSRETRRRVIRVVCSIKIRCMTTEAIGRRIVVVAVGMTLVATRAGMRSCEWPVRIVNGKGGGRPVRCSRMTGCTIGREVQCNVVRIGAGIVIRHVAAIAGVRRIGIIAVVTRIAVARNGNVASRKRIIHTVVKSSGCPGRFAVTSGALV